MKLKKIFLLSGLLLPFGSAFAQYAQDALKFSMSEHGFTARFKALGGAQTALGGDLSSLASNPAGLGLFTKNEVNFTPDFVKNNSDAQYSGSALASSRNKLGFNSIGGVFHLAMPKYSGRDVNTGWLSFNFGLGYNKINDYTGNLTYGGINGKSSFADYLSDLSNSYLSAGDPSANSQALPAGSLESMAYKNFLTEYNSDGYFATTELNNSQQDMILTSGTQSEINLAAGGNYNNQLYIGASLTVSSLNFNADREFLESGKTRAYSGQPADFAGASYALSYRSSQETQGSGIAGKVGVIYRATPNFRMGFSFFTPTWYHVNDIYSEGLDTRYTRANGSAIAPYTNSDEVYESDYTLRTPYKANVGVAVTGSAGLISADVEYVDYSTISFKSDDAVTNTSIKRDIAKNYRSAVNTRVGAEVKLDPILLRGGVSFVGNPYQSLDYSSSTYSGGLGYRKNNFYTDLTYAYSQKEYSTRPYAISAAYPDYPATGAGETAQIKENLNNFFVTIGVRF